MKTTKRFLALFLALIFVLTALPAVSAEDDGDLPEGFLTYTITDGKATVTGVTDRDYEGEVTLPDYIEGYPVTAVTSGFFSTMRGYITTLTLPSTLETIDGGNCHQICIVERFAISEDNEYFCTDDAGVLFNKDKTLLYRFPIVNPLTEYEIPDTVTALANFAFANMNVLEYVKVPGSIETIPYMCFTFSHSLKTIELCEGVKTIGNNAIAECHNMEHVILPSTLETIDSCGISGCNKMKEIVIPASVKVVSGSYAIGDNDELEKIVFLGELEYVYLYDSILKNNKSLKEVWFAGPEEVWNGNAPLSALNLYGATLRCGYAYLPEAEVGFENDILSIDGVESIPDASDGVFYDWTDSAPECGALRLGDSVKSVGSGAFAACPELTEVVICGDGVTVAADAFADCDMLETVIALGDISLAKGALPDGATLYAPQGSAADGGNVVMFSYSDGVLRFDGVIDTDAYQFLDCVAVLCETVGEVEGIHVSSMRLSNVALTYIDKNGDRRYIEDNTLTDASVTAGATDKEGNEVKLTFNELCAGIADGTITSFYLSTSMEQDDEQIDTRTGFNIVDQIVSFIRKVLKSIVTLLNRLFKLIKSIGK